MAHHTGLQSSPHYSSRGRQLPVLSNLVHFYTAGVLMKRRDLIQDALSVAAQYQNLLGATRSTLGTTPSILGTARSTLGTTPSTLGTTPGTLGITP